MSLFEAQASEFQRRHIGPDNRETAAMLKTIGAASLEELIEKTVPAGIRMREELNLPAAMSEFEYLQHLKDVSLQNKVFKTYIGQGYYDTITPAVISRNLFENPAWYTQYTPYQAEIAQGRLESLLNFQTMVSDLTALPLANASLLDEGTAAAEAMAMFFNLLNKDTHHISRPRFFVDRDTFPQTIDVVMTRALPFGIELVVDDYRNAKIDESYFGALIQYPNDKGSVEHYRSFIDEVHRTGGYVAMATDLLALTLLTPPGELGADAAFGSAQRFGVPLGFGGPHAAFFATKDEFRRNIPGRIIGVSIDAAGQRALRMALQTREQHIKREKATSNICTAQALLANMAAMYAVYHGADGLRAIARRVAIMAETVAASLEQRGYRLLHDAYFDTITVAVDDVGPIREKAERQGINFRYFEGENLIGISLDETTTPSDLLDLINSFENDVDPVAFEMVTGGEPGAIPEGLARTSDFLTHPVFSAHRSETQMMRYMRQLESKDYSLVHGMIPLGSCTMKLNAAAEMMPLSWNHWSRIHPFAPSSQTGGYAQILRELSEYLCEITRFDACSLQPNSGAQGEYAGLLAIKGFHESNGEGHRNVMLIPISAHGTNPASAVMCGMHVVVVKALENGYIDVDDLRTKAAQHSANLAGIMITYPSTYGVYEETVTEITQVVHEHGGQVYMDGANMNAQVGLTAPGLIGADVCHLNLHKTFAIPHGGGGPGMGPICVKAHLAAHLPGHVVVHPGTGKAEQIAELRAEAGIGQGAVSSAPFGSASILLISYGYIRMLGNDGVKKATEWAILNANYMLARLKGQYEILYTNDNGQCAHEFIVDLRPFKKSAEIEAEDVAKRLMDYGFHAPTLSFPVAGTIMVEPTESEDKGELDRFCDAMLEIRKEIAAIEAGSADKKDNVLKGAPHTQLAVCANEWTKPYTREQAAFPLPAVKASKFWPSVARVNNTYGDRNLVCVCLPTEMYAEQN